MNVAFIALLVDFGLVVLIWMIQLLVYPSFLHYTKSNLMKWHSSYTPRITTVVAPLMLAQITLATFTLWQEINALSIVYNVLIYSTWIITFHTFIPIHKKIQEGNFSQATLTNLVKLNGYRTAIWTVIFILSYFLVF